MKKVEIEIPDGKRIEWVDNVLTLVDDKPVNIMEKVRGYNDACKVLGIENFLDEPNPIMNMVGIDYEIPKNVIAMMKLETIIEALNEGWVAKDNMDSMWWFPCFYRHVIDDKNNITFEFTGYASSDTGSICNARFALKSSELAEYCGKQFIQLWTDYLLG